LIRLVIAIRESVRIFAVGSKAKSLDSGVRRNDEQERKAGFQLSLE
jgi:hypothetical protein